MKFKYEDLRYSILDGESDEELDLHIIEDGEWTQDGKYQSKIIVFMHDNKYYSIEQTRSGSPFTDWYYEELEIDKDGFIECDETELGENIEDISDKLDEAIELLNDALHLLNNVHCYDTETCRNIRNFLHGEEEE